MSLPLLFDLHHRPDIANSLVKSLPAEHAQLQTRQFPDGETYLRIDADCAARDIVLLADLYRPNAKVLDLLLVTRTLREFEAASIGLVAPYLPYMRQDKQFNPGESITARHFAGLLSDHIDWLVTVDPHLHRIHQLAEVYRVPCHNVHAATAIAGWLADQVDEPIVIGPDSESEQWVSEVASLAGCPWLVLEKVRSGDREVAVSQPEVERYREHTPVIIDDIISTGRTQLATLQQLQQLGMPAAICIAVHGLFADAASDSLLANGAARVVSCNTVYHPSNAIDISPLLVAPIRSCLARA